MEHSQKYGIEIFLVRIFDLEVKNSDKYISTKINSDKDEIRTDLRDQALAPEKMLLGTYSVILTDPV